MLINNYWVRFVSHDIVSLSLRAADGATTQPSAIDRKPTSPFWILNTLRVLEKHIKH